MKQPNPISVRPRQGSKLEAVWNDNERSNKAMGDIIHSWAETEGLTIEHFDNPADAE